MNPFRRKQGESDGFGLRSAWEIEAELSSEDAARARSRSVVLIDAVFEDVLE